MGGNIGLSGFCGSDKSGSYEEGHAGTGALDVRNLILLSRDLLDDL